MYLIFSSYYDILLTPKSTGLSETSFNTANLSSDQVSAFKLSTRKLCLSVPLILLFWLQELLNSTMHTLNTIILLKITVFNDIIGISKCSPKAILRTRVNTFHWKLTLISLNALSSMRNILKRYCHAWLAKGVLTKTQTWQVN